VTWCSTGRRRRLDSFLDPEGREEIGADLEPVDILKFKDSKKYRDRLGQAQKATGEKDALVVMRGSLKGLPLVAAAFEFRFMGGSMGSVVGERRRRSSSGSWVVPWARWWGSGSCARWRSLCGRVSRWSASPPAGAPACRRRSSP